MAEIRGYRESDREAVYDICVRTAAAGGDARGRHSRDDLMGDLFAGPYLTLEPELAFVLDDGGRAVGYVLGTADTPAFVARHAVTWVPYLAGRYPPPHAPSDRDWLAGGLHPERMLRPELAPYPAHLHIDLLPGAQGQGSGRRLIDTFLAAAARAGAPAVHLGMDPANTGARAFYDRLGFEPLATAGRGPLYLVRSTA